MTRAQQIEYLSSAIGGYTGETSDQVQERVLANMTRSEHLTLWLLLHELEQLRRPETLVGKALATATV